MKKTLELKRIDAFSAAKIAGLFYVAFGLFAGTIFSLFSLLGFAGGTGAGIAGLIFGIGSIIFLPIFYGVVGFIMTLATVLVYNWLAKKVGGIKIELE